MGGGMGGMGGGMGGMGGGMRSVPPTGLPFATLEAGPDPATCRPAWSACRRRTSPWWPCPQKGEKLQIGDISEMNADAGCRRRCGGSRRTRRHEPVAQLVMWNVAGKLDWETIASCPRSGPTRTSWPGAGVRRQARHAAGRREGDVALEILAAGRSRRRWPSELTQAVLEGHGARSANRAGSPRSASRARRGLQGAVERTRRRPRRRCRWPSATVQHAWVPVGKFTLRSSARPARSREKFADSLAEGILAGWSAPS